MVQWTERVCIVNIYTRHIYIYHIVCKQYICKQIINLYVFIVYDEFCIYVYNYKKKMNISIEGQILSIRKISKKLSFCDFMLFHNNNNETISNKERIEIIVKPIFNNDNNNNNNQCGVNDVSEWIKEICVGDHIKISGQYENNKDNHIKTFRVHGNIPTMIKAWKKHNTQPFIPPVIQYKTSSPTSSLNNMNNLCKYFTTTKSCPKGNTCRFLHTTDINLRKEWLKNRKTQKLINGRIKNDTIPLHKKKSKGARADIFATFLVNKFGGADMINKNGGVLDVAGGRGDLSFELNTKYNIKCTLIDPRQRKLNKRQRRYILKKEKEKQKHVVIQNKIDLGDDDDKKEEEPKAKKQKISTNNFNNNNNNNCNNNNNNNSNNNNQKKIKIDQQLLNDYLGQHIQNTFDSSFEIATIGGKQPLVVGMHPDQATEDIVDIALKHKLNFAIVPCCVFPKDKSRKKMSFEEWCEFLSNKTDGIQSEFLSFTGANRVLYKII